MRALLVLVASCGAAVPAVPGKGGPTWTELTSEHFVLWTDGKVARGKQLVREMEHLRQVVLGMAFPSAPDAGKSIVIAPRDGYEVRAYIPEPFIAYAVGPGDGNPIHQPMIVFAADTDESDGHVIVHELTHVISNAVIHRQPTWFAEGLARFFESVHLDADREMVDVGEPPPTTVQTLSYRRLLSARELFGCTTTACEDDRFYTTSWALFSYLANEHPTELVTFEERLDKVADWHEAWHEVFPALEGNTLDSEIRGWLTHGQHRVWHFKVKLHQETIAERTLADADVYAARALMGAIFYRHDAQTKNDIAAALALDATNVIANAVAVTIDPAARPADAAAIAAAHPDDWRAWWLVTLSATGDAAVTARAQACALAARDPGNAPPGGLCRH